MDCNISNSPRKRRGKKEYVVNEQENEEQQPTSLILTCLRAVNEQENEEQQQNKPIEASTINQAVSTQIEQPQTADTTIVSTTRVRVNKQKHVDGGLVWCWKDKV